MDQCGHGRGTMHGGFSQYSLVKSKYCYPFQTDISPNEAVLLEPMGLENVRRWSTRNPNICFFLLLFPGVAYNGIESGIGVQEKEVLIIVRHIMTICWHRLRLTKNDGNNKQKLAFLPLSSFWALDSFSKSRRAAAAAAAAKQTQEVFCVCLPFQRAVLIIACCRGASLVLIGLPKSALHVENPLQNIIFKAITLKTVHGRKIWDTWQKCEQLIAHTNKVITIYSFPLTECRWPLIRTRYIIGNRFFLSKGCGRNCEFFLNIL